MARPISTSAIPMISFSCAAGEVSPVPPGVGLEIATALGLDEGRADVAAGDGVALGVGVGVGEGELEGLGVGDGLGAGVVGVGVRVGGGVPGLPTMTVPDIDAPWIPQMYE